MAKMAAETPDVMAFNGYANQYKANPITVRRGEKIRMYVLDAGPSKWSAFHVIGTVFDTHLRRGRRRPRRPDRVLRAVSQGGWVEFTLDQEGNYPFVTHAFGDMVKGAAGILHTTGAPKVAAPAPAPAAAAGHDDGAPWRPTSTRRSARCGSRPTRRRSRPGNVTFAVKNTGATMHGLAIVAAPGQGAGRDARRVHVPRQGQGARRRAPATRSRPTSSRAATSSCASCPATTPPARSCPSRSSSRPPAWAGPRPGGPAGAEKMSREPHGRGRSDAARSACAARSRERRPDDHRVAGPDGGDRRAVRGADRKPAERRRHDHRPCRVSHLHGRGRFRLHRDPRQGGDRSGATGGERRIYDADGNLIRETGDEPSGNAEADAAYDNFGAVYDYYHSTIRARLLRRHGRPADRDGRLPDSLLGRRLRDPGRQQMFFCEGFAGPLDVTAHELTHAVTERTAGLEYKASRARSTRRSPTCSPPTSTARLADRRGPARRRHPRHGRPRPRRDEPATTAPTTGLCQPAHVDDYYVTDNDHGGVHTNSGIPNHAYYLMVQRIGREAAEQIVYARDDRAPQPDSGFEDFRAACLQAARDRYGADSPEYRGVDEAFREVGLDGTWEAPR